VQEHQAGDSTLSSQRRRQPSHPQESTTDGTDGLAGDPNEASLTQTCNEGLDLLHMAGPAAPNDIGVAMSTMSTQTLGDFDMMLQYVFSCSDSHSEKKRAI